MYRSIWNALKDDKIFLIVICVFWAVLGVLLSGFAGIVSRNYSILNVISCEILSGWCLGLCGGTLFLYRKQDELGVSSGKIC